MEVYKGPCNPLGRRHDNGATCAKMDCGVKFLGRYHTGQMYSGNFIVTDEAGVGAFTQTGTFLVGNFHRVGGVVGSDGSICQGQFKNWAVPRGGHAVDHGQGGWGGPGWELSRGSGRERPRVGRGGECVHRQLRRRPLPQVRRPHPPRGRPLRRGDPNRARDGGGRVEGAAKTRLLFRRESFIAHR